MSSAGARVLIVDDHEPWRRRIRSLIEARSGWEIVGEAADGVDAVERADTLRPDVILLDVELPRANGLEAAARILAADPAERILFVTAHRSWDIAEAALATGARGYILKVDAEFQLLLAMDAIVQNRRFVSPVLGGRQLRDDGRPRRHEVVCYSDEAQLLDEYAHTARAALGAGNACVIFSMESRRQAFEQRLRAGGINLDLAITQQRYIWLDAVTAISPLMVDGLPDRGRFWETVPAVIMRAARVATGRRPGVVVCGDGAGRLWAEGRTEAAVRVEQLCDELVSTYDVDMLCGYPLVSPRDGDAAAFECICHAHTVVYSR